MMHDKYRLTLVAIGAIIVVPAGVTRIAGASVRVLAFIAVIQLCVLLAFWVTSLVSLALGVRSLTERKWKEAGGRAVAMAIPMVTWLLVAFTNAPGWDAVMGI